jgi:beta-lactamase regulating signal transducer with metallopeptidase domain
MEPFLLDMALKGAVVLALTGALAAGARSASAATRHLVWSIGLGAALALPFLQWLLPEWSWAVLPATGRLVGFDPPPAAAAEPGVERTLVWLWGIGIVATLIGFLVGRARVRWISRHATPVDHGPWSALLLQVSGEIGLSRRVRLLQAPETTLPMMWGILRPTILIPREANGWSPALRREVMLHELAHVQRHDYLTQTIARLACALHWFDPLAWVAARRMRLERERACDDRVLDGGSSPCDYAEHLLAVARWSSTGVRSGALGMAGSSPLGDRLKAVLGAGRSRRRVSPRAALGHTALAAFLVVPLAVLHPESAPRLADAGDPGSVLPIPPSASAGLRGAGGSRPPRAVIQEGAASAVEEVPGSAIEDAAPFAAELAAPRTVRARARVTARERWTTARRAIRAERDRSRPPVVAVSHAAGVRVPATVRLEMRADTRVRSTAGKPICAKSQKGTSGDEPTPIVPSRTTLAAVSRPIVTP